MKYFVGIVVATAIGVGPVLAEQAPSQETKIKALKCAYYLNGNSFRGWGSIDLTRVDLDRCVKAANGGT